MKPSNFELNKIIGALLLAAIIAMVSGFLSMGLYKGSITEHAGHHEEKRGYTIEGAEEVGGEGAVAAVEEAPVDIMTLMATADVAAGEKQIKKCTACHTFDKGGKNGVGPNNFGIVGANIAHRSDFSYSATLTAMKDKKWTEQALSEFLTNPKKFAPGNKMAFAGIKNPQDRANLIAYLKTLK